MMLTLKNLQLQRIRLRWQACLPVAGIMSVLVCTAQVTADQTPVVSFQLQGVRTELSGLSDNSTVNLPSDLQANSGSMGLGLLVFLKPDKAFHLVTAASIRITHT